MPEVSNASHRLIEALLDRIYAAISRGPAINAFPGQSRQRIDLAALGDLAEFNMSDQFKELLTGSGVVRKRITLEKLPAEEEGEGPEIARKRADQRKRVAALKKLAVIADDARSYEMDTGANTLYIGYPLLSIHKDASGNFVRARVVAPIALIPIVLSASNTGNAFFEIKTAGEAADKVIVNEALKALIESNLGKDFPEVLEDEEAEDPVREITELTNAIAGMLELPAVPDLTTLKIDKIPELADLPDGATIIPGGVLGLFRLDYQNTIADLKTLLTMETFPQTIAPFLTLNEKMVPDENLNEDEGPLEKRAFKAADSHLIALTDPCQRRAVERARTSRCLVVHGPPGTGKSQTIANILGDHLANGKRVLFVCEKRTALDVVKHRLDRMGLGHLCAVVHDATRDRYPLYKGIREYIENLPEGKSIADPSRKLSQINTELDATYGELREYFDALDHIDDETNLPFTQLVGLYLQNLEAGNSLNAKLHPELGSIELDVILPNEGDIRAALDRADRVQYGLNPWAKLTALDLDKYLARPSSEWKEDLEAMLALAEDVDVLEVDPGIPFAAAVDLRGQAAARETLATDLETRASAQSIDGVNQALVKLDAVAVGSLTKALDSIAAERAEIDNSIPLDLAAMVDMPSLKLNEVMGNLGTLESYQRHGFGFLGWFRFTLRRLAGEILRKLGLAETPAATARAIELYRGVRARLMVHQVLQSKLDGVTVPAPQEDTKLANVFDLAKSTATLLLALETDSNLRPVSHAVHQALVGDTTNLQKLADDLRASVPRAEAIAALDMKLRESTLLNGEAKTYIHNGSLTGEKVAEHIRAMLDQLPTVEDVLRFDYESGRFPLPVTESLRTLATANAGPVVGWQLLLAAIFKAGIDRRLAEDPALARKDSARLDSLFNRMEELFASKRSVEIEAIQFLWRARQVKRLVANTGSRLNSDGADLKRRLMLRGRNAGRIRQVIQQGTANAHGDPLFDVCPVWMASPETAAQIFPFESMFDLVVFDEASQCRLEEGLGVMRRAERVVVAGDTRQLPPTRFFEGAAITSAKEYDEGDADSLFTTQQSEIEDLLTAALNIEADQSYLDVHYRSADDLLIHYSNHAFYGLRLQPLPPGPGLGIDPLAISLHSVMGTYKDRQNEGEAKKVVELVREYLSQPTPPSIGIVTFNLTQKDLITDCLNAEAENDPEFASLLESARNRVGGANAEGLFVKNLESVQGDERDVIILSTTYGNDEKGRFYRRFGPLALAGGERRLNVIITRSRIHMDIVTSIPPDQYQHLAAVPEGAKATGSWYLMDFLRFVKALQDTPMEEGTMVLPKADVAPHTLSGIIDSSLGKDTKIAGTCVGTSGFYVDMCIEPEGADRLIGVQLDGTRYRATDDPLEWDAFQMGILKSRQWTIHRIWSAEFLRDRDRSLTAIRKAVHEHTKLPDTPK